MMQRGLFILLTGLFSLQADAQHPGDQVWFFPTGAPVISSPALDHAGNVVFGSEDSLVYSLTSDQQVNWAVASNDLVTGNVSVGPDGSCVFGSWDGLVYSIDPQGSVRWSYDTKAFISGSPAVAIDGTAYIGARDGLLYALEADGGVKWVYVADGGIRGGPAIGADGTVFFGDEAGTFHALNPDGTVKWQFVADPVTDRNSRIRTTPAIDRQGTVYFGSGNHFFYALYPNGDLKWKYETGDMNDSSPVIDGGGNIIFGCRDGYLYKLRPSSGVPAWARLIGDVFYASPAVDSQDNLYIAAFVGSGVSRLFAIAPDSTTLWTRNYAGLNDSSPVLSNDGFLYIGFHDGNLYKLYAGHGPARSVWPMQGRNAARASNLDEAFATAEEVDGWLQSQWFGWMRPLGDGWFFHFEHHYIYAPLKDPNSYWYYDTSLGTWCYTSKVIYPFMYFPVEGWAYYLRGTVEPNRWMYVYSTGWKMGSELKAVLEGG